VRAVQAEQNVTYTETHYTDDVVTPDDPRLESPGPVHRLRQAWEVMTYELTGLSPAQGRYFGLEELRALHLSDTLPRRGATAVAELPYHRPAAGGEPAAGHQKRKVQHVVTRFFARDLLTPLAPGRLSPLGLVHETYRLALTRSLLQDVLGTRFDAATQAALDVPAAGGYRKGTAVLGAAGAGQWWIGSGVAGFAPKASSRFYLPESYRDPFGNETRVAYDQRYRLFVESVTDAAGNRSRVLPAGTPSRPRFDYRVLAPVEIEDANGNRSEVAFDVLGMVIAVAVKGKGAEADDLSGYSSPAFANPDASSVAALVDLDGLTLEQVRARLAPVLRNATSRHIYHFGEEVQAGGVAWGRRPAASCAIARERHVASLQPGDPPSPLQVTLEVSDGLGTVLMTRRQAEAAAGASALRWVVSGKTVVNNKGRPVKQYEPYFSASALGAAGGTLQEEAGVTPLMTYDAGGRLVRTDLPDGTFSRVEFSPWHLRTYDTNDTVRASAWYRERGSPDPAQPLAPYATAAVRAAWQAAQHDGTPSVSCLDSLGREVVVIVHNRVRDATGRWRDERYDTFSRLDAEGKPLWIRDPRGNLAMRYTVPRAGGADPTVSFFSAYDIAGNLLYHESMDAGERWKLADAGGQTIRAWDRNEANVGNALVLQDRLHVFEFDELRRPVAQWLSITGGPAQRVALTQYRDGRDNDAAARAANLQGQAVRQYDSSGLTESVRRDLNGNVTEVRRRLNNTPTASLIDWQGNLAARLEAEMFVRITEYDALSRVTRQFNWHRGTGTRVAVYEPSYNPRGLLASDRLRVRATKSVAGYAATAATRTATPTRQVAYDARGRPTRLERGNGTVTRYEYDPRTFRPVQVRTSRSGADLPFPNTHAGLQDARIVQQMNYTYDPGGNVVEGYDEAYEPVFFRNQMVLPRSRYEYDALYRLTEASGREDAALPTSTAHADADPGAVTFPVGPADPRALRNYSESFRYDAAGNLTRVTHAAGPGSWTRFLEYEPSNNRIVRSWNGDPDPTSAAARNVTTYRCDTHGNLRNLAGVAPAQFLRWDHRDLLAGLDLLGGGRAYYQYDADGRRTRKGLVRTGFVEERIDLGGYQLYRRYPPGGGNVPVEEVESLHVIDGERRVLLVDDVISSRAGQARTLFRYQYEDHVGSACLELDDQAAIISYEQYHPYGTSAHRLANAAVEAPPKRYRHMGLERDEESGLTYAGARYLVPWLCRWATPDPTGIADGPNLYRAFRSNPIVLGDPSGTQTDLLTVRFPAHYYRLGGPLGVCRERVPGVTDLPKPPSRPEDGPQMYANDPNLAMKRANSIFPPHQQEMFEKTIRGPVLAVSAPAVAVTVGAAGIVEGTHGLATGDYDRAVLAYSVSLEVLPFVSPEFAATSNSRMSLAIKQSNLELEREWVVASLSEQRAAHTLQTNAALASSQGRAAADEFASFALDRVAPQVGAEALSARAASRELGPVATVVVDSRYPNIEVGLNIQRGRGLPPTAAEMQQLRESLHPILRTRLDALEAHLAELQRTGQITDAVERAGVAGTHSEIVALNKAIKAREALTGVSVTERDLADFVYVNRNLQGPFAGQCVPPPCYNCSYLIRGTTAGQ
jgi:RHS repeat-associated protein